MGYNILIADDVTMNRKLLKLILNKNFNDIFVYEAEDGKKAVKCMDENEIDIVILDLVMPEQDGFQVLNRMKLKKKTDQIPVIVNSALDDIDSIKRALELGAYDYFTKPLNKEQSNIVLPLKIKNAIKSYEQKRLLKETQDQLIISEKMAVIGNMVAGLAHEINNPLSSIKSNIEIEKMLIDTVNFNEQEKVKEFKNNLSVMNGVSIIAINGILNVIKGLNNFAKLDEAEYKKADLIEGIDSTIFLIENQLKNRIKIIKKYKFIPKIKCHPQQLNQVFLNILINALQAIENEGYIKISTYIRNDEIYIIFEDNGKGIPEKNLSKIFDAGFTTKGVGIGTGLGLSISYKIIKNHNGKIHVESKDGKGTKFTIVIPIL